MRPRRPYVATLAEVTINRSGESAVILYRDPAVHPVFAIGPEIDQCGDGVLARQTGGDGNPRNVSTRDSGGGPISESAALRAFF
jgi:hypothetical protein